MPKKKKSGLWSASVGGYGYSVEVYERKRAGPLYLRARGIRKSLGHSDKKSALDEARRQAGELLMTEQTVRTGGRPFRYLFARYQAEVSAYKKGQGPKEDARRIELWEHFFGAHHDARRIKKGDVRRFERQRRAGQIKLPDLVIEQPDGTRKVRKRKLAAKPSETTIGADIVFLLSVLNWAMTVGEGDGALLDANPIAGHKPPKTPAPKRPVATRERFLRVYRHTRELGRGMFRHFFALIGDELDWRVSALCQIKISDVDLAARPELGAPYGRVRRDGDVDKEGMEGWVPLSPRGRVILQRAVRARRAIGDVYLFESPKRKGKPWTRWHARDLLEKAEERAGILPLDGGDWHPYRRLWSTRRKHYPWADIQAVTGRKDRRTFERSYTAPDPDTILAVVMAGRQEKRAEKATKLSQNMSHNSA